jgi:hypothetical protein
MTVKYSNLIPHAGHELEFVDYNETANLNCKTCGKLIQLFNRPEIWTAEEGEGFTAYNKVLYTSLPLDKRLGLPWDIITLHHRADISQGDRVRIVECKSDPTKVGRVVTAKNHNGGTEWYVEHEGVELKATIKPIPTRTQRAAAAQLLEALKELLNHVDYEDPTVREEQREAFLAIAAAYGIEA